MDSLRSSCLPRAGLENGTKLTLSERFSSARLTENSNEVFKNYLTRAAGKGHRPGAA